MTTQAEKAVMVPKGCPPLIAELVQKTGSKGKAWKAAGFTSEGMFYGVIKGNHEFTDSMRANVEAALRGEHVEKLEPKNRGGRRVRPQKVGGALRNGHATQEPPPVVQATPAPPPPFVEWDGKTVAVKVEGKYGRNDQKFKKCPIPIAELLKRHDWSRLNAARAIGYSNAAPITDILNEEREFDLKLQKKVHNALHGVSERDTSEFTAADTFAMGLAICVVNLSNYERLEELAEVMKGAILMRKSAGNAGWLVIWRFPKREDLQSFKRLGIRDAKEIICP